MFTIYPCIIRSSPAKRPQRWSCFAWQGTTAGISCQRQKQVYVTFRSSVASLLDFNELGNYLLVFLILHLSNVIPFLRSLTLSWTLFVAHVHQPLYQKTHHDHVIKSVMSVCVSVCLSVCVCVCVCVCVSVCLYSVCSIFILSHNVVYCPPSKPIENGWRAAFLSIKSGLVNCYKEIFFL